MHGVAVNSEYGNIKGDHYACQRIFFQYDWVLLVDGVCFTAVVSLLSTLLETSLIGKLSWTSRSHSTHHVTEHNNSHMIV